MQGFGRLGLPSLATAAMPALRVIGLAYTGLAGMIAMVIVVGVALMPVSPALQQATEPARQAVSNLVQPTGDALVNLFGGPGVRIATPRPLSALATIDVTVVDNTPLENEEPLAELPAQPAPVAVVNLILPTVEPQPVLEEPTPEDTSGIEDEPAPQAIDAPPPAPVVVQPAERAVLQIASAEPPRALPVPQTSLQVKARVDAENQAAIDTARSAQARAKMEADAANNAAIAARKVADANAATVKAQAEAATAAAVAAATPAAVTASPTASPTNPSKAITAAQSKAASDAANQAAIDAAKKAKLNAQNQANAANAAAIAGAKAKSTPAPTPTAQPTPPSPPPPSPTAQPTPEPAVAPAVDDSEDDEGVPSIEQSTDASDAPLEDGAT
jgi:hypothetical protein